MILDSFTWYAPCISADRSRMNFRPCSKANPPMCREGKEWSQNEKAVFWFVFLIYENVFKRVCTHHKYNLSKLNFHAPLTTMSHLALFPGPTSRNQPPCSLRGKPWATPPPWLHSVDELSLKAGSVPSGSMDVAWLCLTQRGINPASGFIWIL